LSLVKAARQVSGWSRLTTSNELEDSPSLSGLQLESGIELDCALEMFLSQLGHPEIF
jgi:hypothetical protein